MGRKEKARGKPPGVPALSRVEGPALSRVEGPALSRVEGMARDRREILKRVPKLRKIKPPKPGR